MYEYFLKCIKESSSNGCVWGGIWLENRRKSAIVFLIFFAFFGFLVMGICYLFKI